MYVTVLFSVLNFYLFSFTVLNIILIAYIQCTLANFKSIYSFSLFLETFVICQKTFDAYSQNSFHSGIEVFCSLCI